jgi:predicted Holliday junction resolvase-like endonuclease
MIDFLTIILLIFGVLQIILFFKVWGMTNDIKDIRNKYLKDEDEKQRKNTEYDVITYNPQIQISAESETKRSIFREKDKTKRSKKESAQHSKSRNKSFVMTSVSAL